MDLNDVIEDVPPPDNINTTISNNKSPSNIGFFYKYKNIIYIIAGITTVFGYIGYKYFTSVSISKKNEIVNTTEEINNVSSNLSIKRNINSSSDIYTTTNDDNNTITTTTTIQRPTTTASGASPASGASSGAGLYSSNSSNNTVKYEDTIEYKALTCNTSVNLKYQNPSSYNIQNNNTNNNTNTMNNNNMGNIQNNNTNNNYKHYVTPGKIIKAVLVNEINSDLQGIIMARTNETIYNPDGINIAIPQGTILLCNYSSDISWGQKRLEVVWKRMVLPDGTVVDTDEKVSDSMGRAGLPANVNRHIILRLSGIGMTFIYSTSLVALDKTLKQTTPEGATIVESTAQPLLNTADKIIDRSLYVPNTLTVKQGTLLNVIVFNPIVF